MIDLRNKTLDRTAQAAEGMVRRRFTVAELEAMVVAGIIDQLSTYCPIPAGSGGSFIRPRLSWVSEPK